MEDPLNEVAQVVKLVTAAVNPDVQKAAVLKYGIATRNRDIC